MDLFMITLSEAKTRLAKNKRRLFERYPLVEMGIFGSLAREEAGQESDIDILVEFSAPVGFEIVDLVEDLEALLESPVDLVSKKALRPLLLASILEDIQYV
ncbi:MAG: hypothetical protein KIPDCIKN_03630 [Haliscomenobacter sp.]|jgi:predicted nucleotidyltransferase|nr:hypothetical protein [Haliscomenobacter sp.]